MNVTVEVHRTREYFAESFAQGLLFTKWRRWAPYGVVVLLVLGVFLVAWAPEFWYFGAFYFGASAYEAFKIWYTQRVWIRDRMEGPAAGQKATYIFSDDGIRSIGPHGEGTISWEGVFEARVSDRGLNLLIEKGIGIHLPRALFATDAQLESVAGKCRTVRRR